MSKTIDTLIPDIYSLVQSKDGWFNDNLAEKLSTGISRSLSEQLGQNTRKPTLRLSAMGPRCPKAVWFSVNRPELAETLPPWAEIKYSYGHVLEALVITFARAAGHTVTGEQDELILDGIVGHRDAVIDGCVVDVKSASSRSFSKFKDGTISKSDSFGYLDQLDGYVIASLNDPLVTVKDRGYLLAIDKQLGHMCLYEHNIEGRETILRDRIKYFKDVVSRDQPPPCECGTEPQGRSGNIKLDIKASYSPWKYCCRPLLRTFLYSTGPEFLTKVVRKPDVPEVDRHGKLVYNRT